ncbi:DUF359 domain-containing protein [Candidatus Gottesmanbacteria bacterium]|nr:DUF359 domain-containing protein [Candidatus Gottesmanbacteria bacterium]
MYRLIAIAGTFDRLHKGHKFFISEAFKLGEKVMIGLTSDSFVKEKFEIRNLKLEKKSDKDTSEVAGIQRLLRGGGIKVQNYQTRKKELEDFLTREKLLDRAEIVKIDNVYGPAIGKTEIEALVVTSETLEGGFTVNRRRSELGLKPLKLLKIPLILAEDNKRIASTRIRLGEIDRWGRIYLKKLKAPFEETQGRQSSKLKINEEIRQELKKPQGILIKGDSQNLPKIIPELKSQIVKLQPVVVITVGDEVTKLANQIDLPISLAIFDYKVGREEKYHSLEDLGFGELVIPSDPPVGGESRDLSHMRARTSREIPPRATLGRNDIKSLKVENPPSHITKELVNSVKNAYLGIIKDGKQRIIEVTGEEDLAGVPAILLSPLGSVVLYGQPQEGIVVVEVTEKRKKRMMELIEKSY